MIDHVMNGALRCLGSPDNRLAGWTTVYRFLDGLLHLLGVVKVVFRAREKLIVLLVFPQGSCDVDLFLKVDQLRYFDLLLFLHGRISGVRSILILRIIGLIRSLIGFQSLLECVERFMRSLILRARSESQPSPHLLLSDKVFDILFLDLVS